MTVLSPDEVRFRDDLARALTATIPVDVDAEWAQLQRTIGPAAGPVYARPSRLPWLVAAAALIVAILALARPIALEVRIADAVRDLVGIEAPESPVLPTTTAVPAPTTTVPVPTTTLPPPPETTTTMVLPDVSHAPILDDDAYRETVRQVHEQINDAVGFNRTNLDALAGSAERLEGLLGQDPALDDLLSQTIFQLRRALDERDRDAAVTAHRLVVEIENRRAAR